MFVVFVPGSRCAMDRRSYRIVRRQGFGLQGRVRLFVFSRFGNVPRCSDLVNECGIFNRLKRAWSSTRAIAQLLQIVFIFDKVSL